MLDSFETPDQKPLRSPNDVMRLRRLGASFPTRLSFLRTLMRALSSEKSEVTRPVWEMCADGFGHAVYQVSLGGHIYSLVAVSSDIPPHLRTDRVIATVWDSAYVLFDGIPQQDDIDRIVRNAPLQEAGRFSAKELVLSRANKSIRLFDHTVQALRNGEQPDQELVASTGYLMRTTAVYGNGKFGIADRSAISERPFMSGPFASEMLTVWLIRGFTHDLVEHVGQGPLDRDIKRQLGIGNSTGLGMAPFLVTHPMLLDAWIQVRETAIARVRAIPSLNGDQIERIYELTARAAQHLAEWSVPDEVAAQRIDVLRAEWPKFAKMLTPERLSNANPMDTIVSEIDNYSIDTQELVLAMILEPFGELVDGLTDCMSTPFTPQIEPQMLCTDVAKLVEDHWGWACSVDYQAAEDCAQFWYVSEEKLEPRLGNRHEEEGADLESPLDIGRQIKALKADLPNAEIPIARFLMDHPQHRSAVRRVQTLALHPYSEIRDNLIGNACLPIDMLRCKLAFFGAAKFDPKSDRWTRITLAQGAPLRDELDNADDWWLPTFAA